MPFEGRFICVVHCIFEFRLFFIITERSSPNSHQNLLFPLMANRTARRFTPSASLVRLCVLRRPAARSQGDPKLCPGEIVRIHRPFTTTPRRRRRFCCSRLYDHPFCRLLRAVFFRQRSPSDEFADVTPALCARPERVEDASKSSPNRFPRRHGRDTDRVQTMLRFRDVHVMVAPIHGRFFERRIKVLAARHLRQCGAP